MAHSMHKCTLWIDQDAYFLFLLNPQIMGPNAAQLTAAVSALINALVASKFSTQGALGLMNTISYARWGLEGYVIAEANCLKGESSLLYTIDRGPYCCVDLNLKLDLKSLSYPAAKAQGCAQGGLTPVCMQGHHGPRVDSSTATLQLLSSNEGRNCRWPPCNAQ